MEKDFIPLDKAQAELKNENESVQESLMGTIIEFGKDAESIGEAAMNLSDTLAAVPVIGIGASIWKFGSGIQRLRFQKKLLAFVDGVRRRKVPQSDIDAFIGKLSKDADEKEKVLTEIIETLDRLRSEEKAAIYANLFAAFVRGNLNWERLVTVTQCLESLNSGAFDSFLMAAIPTSIENLEVKISMKGW